MVPANVSEPREMTCPSPPLMPAEDGCRCPNEHGAQPTLQPPPQEGKSLVRLFDGGTLVSQSFAQSLLQSILSSVESRDPVVATAWADTLLDVLELLPRATISQQVLPVAVQKGQVSQSPLSRLVSCRLLGAVAALLEPVVVQKELLPLAESLCRDPDPDVRASMCCQLGTLTRSVGLGMTKQYLLPCLVELSSDADSAVRRAALEATVTMLGLLDDVPCRDNLVSLVLRWRRRSAGELAFLATQFGPLCRLPTGIVEKDGWLVELYRELSTAGLCDLVQFVTAESFEAVLLPVWQRLCADPDSSVRSVIAGAVIQEEQLVELVSASEACIARVGLKWRREVAIWSGLGCLTGPLLQTSLKERITRHLLQRTQASGPLPCRLAAVQSLVAFLRCGTSGREQLLTDITRAEDSVESIRRQAGRCLEQLEPRSTAEQQSKTSKPHPASTRRLKAMALCVLKGSSLEHHSSSKVPVSARHWPTGAGDNLQSPLANSFQTEPRNSEHKLSCMRLCSLVPDGYTLCRTWIC
ncbi:hypothetical protein HPB49_002560 [Dermacentor silvarum]|uniref:Uncharacterized protein n=1 Tax=Dermacentor silvarum TaxID=543639 RepID=A0ACB8C0L7_DERSI|nr:hypothetical protein HPB49_002560 [Dermacentor silvarum]